eukprot:937228-Prorocentrum_minimum.AAC.1
MRAWTAHEVLLNIHTHGRLLTASPSPTPNSKAESYPALAGGWSVGDSTLQPMGASSITQNSKLKTQTQTRTDLN